MAVHAEVESDSYDNSRNGPMSAKPPRPKSFQMSETADKRVGCSKPLPELGTQARARWAR
jgi:hypothetical protein